MSTAGRASAASHPVEFNGKTYRMSPIINSPKAWSEIGNILKQKRVPALSTVSEHLDQYSESQQRIILTKAVELDSHIHDEPDSYTIAAFMETLEGLSTLAWIGLRENHPELTCPEDCLEILGTDIAEVSSKLDAVGGFTELGEPSAGESPNQAAAIAPEQRTPGQESTSV